MPVLRKPPRGPTPGFLQLSVENTKMSMKHPTVCYETEVELENLERINNDDKIDSSDSENALEVAVTFDLLSKISPNVMNDRLIQELAWALYSERFSLKGEPLVREFERWLTYYGADMKTIH